MIFFVCEQCGQRHELPYDAAGTLVFCSCGHGNCVPSESAVPVAAVPPRPENAPPVLEALPVEEKSEGGPWQPRSQPFQGDAHPHDPAYCFNHEDMPFQHQCADCGLSFCDACVLRWQGHLLCGPCKNYRIRNGQQPPRTSTLAVVSLVVALVGGPFSFCMMAFGVGNNEPAVGVIGLLAPLVALGLGVAALRTIEQDPHIGGRSLALTGIIGGFLSAVTVGMMFFLIGRMME